MKVSQIKKELIADILAVLIFTGVVVGISQLGLSEVTRRAITITSVIILAFAIGSFRAYFRLGKRKIRSKV